MPAAKTLVATTSFVYEDKDGNVHVVRQGEEFPSTHAAVKVASDLFESK